MDAVNPLNILNTLNLEHGGALDTVNALNILNTLNLEHGGALIGRCKSSKHSEHSEFGTWWCFEWML